MEKLFKYGISVLLIIVLMEAKSFAGTSITVTGDWIETIDSLDLQGGPGGSLISDYESEPNVGEIRIRGAGLGSWRVDVGKIDINWHSNFRLYVHRTSPGQGKGDISGGKSYQEITDVDQPFFSGSRSRREIFIQLKLIGVSILVPPGTYSTTVRYTVVDI